MALTPYGELRNQLLRQGWTRLFAPAVLRDADNNFVPIPISERLVQAIWFDQRLNADNLHTTDGRPVRVIFPGWWNLEAGPDFRHATVQIGRDDERTGDVEIHLRADDWFHHGHHNDPGYNNVILHAVLWEASSQKLAHARSGETIPQLVLQHQLSSPLEVLYDELDLDAYPHGTFDHGGKCVQVFETLSSEDIDGLLASAGDERFAMKARKYARWIHRHGPDQAFYEGWMESLGYKSNKTGFRTLAQRLPLCDLAGHKDDLAPLMFGVAGFLPVAAAKSRDPSARQYMKRLWSSWWKIRPEFEERILPAQTWRLRGIRPANHPHRRLGAAIALLREGTGLLETMMNDVRKEESGDAVARHLTSLSDAYWSNHYTIGGPPQKSSSELIGEARAQEMITNVVLPFAVALAEITGDNRLLKRARARYADLKATSTNSVVRLASQQLFGNVKTAQPFLRSERQQQGLIQIFQDFCLNDKSACQQCLFPGIAKAWSEKRPLSPVSG
jgi:hypothetical protein